MNELRSPHGTLHHLPVSKVDTMTPKSIESSLQDLSIELLRSKIGQPLHLSQNVVGSWLGTLVARRRPGTSSKHIGRASGACPTAVAHTSTFIWRLSGGSGEGSVEEGRRAEGSQGGLSAGARRMLRSEYVGISTKVKA